MMPVYPPLSDLVARVAGAIPWRLATSDELAEAPPSTLETLRDYWSRYGCIVVDPRHSDATIFGAPDVNHAFRAWHDSEHLRLNAGFDRQGELDVCRAQQATARGLMRQRDPAEAHLVHLLIECEIVGQFTYAQDHGAFPADQRAFTAEWMKARLPRRLYKRLSF